MKAANRSSKIINFRDFHTSYNAVSEREDNIIGRKIADFRAANRMSLTDLRILLETYGISISNASINKWETGASVPNIYQFVAVMQALGVDENISFFTRSAAQLNPEGLRKLHDYRDDLIATGKYKPATMHAFEEEYVDMQISTLSVSAGTGTFLDEGNFETVSFPKSAVPDRADFGVRVSGDSMEPVYHDGQIAWVQECSELSPGEVGIFMYDGDGYIKKYDEQEPCEAERDEFTDSDGSLHMQAVLISYNKKYKPKLVSPLVGFSIVGRVLN